MLDWTSRCPTDPLELSFGWLSYYVPLPTYCRISRPTHGDFVLQAAPPAVLPSQQFAVLLRRLAHPFKPPSLYLLRGLAQRAALSDLSRRSKQ